MDYVDAERLVVDYLNRQGVGATAYYDVPSKRPDTFVVVERTGGALSDRVIEMPMLDIQCWDKSRAGASFLAMGVIDALNKMPAVVESCFHVSITSTYRDVDLDSGTPRYHVVAELTLNL